MSAKWFVIFLVGLAVLAALCVDLYPLFGGYADRRFVLISIMLVMAPVTMLAVRSSGIVLSSGFWLFVGSVAVSTIFFEDVSRLSFVESFFYPTLLLAVAGLAFLIKLQPLSFPGTLISLVAAGAMVYAFLTPAIYIFAVLDDVSRLDQFLPWGFVNIRYWSQVASWLLPLLPLAVMAGPLRESRLWRLGIAITAGVWWWLLIMSSARGSLVGIVLGVVIAVLLFGHHARQWLTVLGTQISYGVLAWVMLSVVIPFLFIENPEMRSIGTDTSGRIPLWREAWAMSLVNFPFGMGPQSWLTHELITSAYEEHRKMGHPHNMYLMWAAEYGWLAVMGLVLIGVSVLGRLFDLRSRMQRHALSYEQSQLVIVLTASVTAAMIHAGASAVLIAPASMLTGLVVGSLFWAVLSRAEPAEVEGRSLFSGSQNRPRYVAAFVVFSFLVVWYMEVVHYYQAMRVDEPWYLENVPQSKQPRFWFHGNFPRRNELMPEDNDQILVK